tara:strand:- start:427 stop:570 length:144 start_codon:yes stop_codon:yes gene_type:complete
MKARIILTIQLAKDSSCQIKCHAFAKKVFFSFFISEEKSRRVFKFYQ